MEQKKRWSPGVVELKPSERASQEASTVQRVSVASLVNSRAGVKYADLVLHPKAELLIDGCVFKKRDMLSTPN